MKKRVFVMPIVMLVGLSLIAFASASALSQELQCRINFNIGVLSSMANVSSNASSQLQSSISVLQSDLNKIQSLGNSTAVQSFVKTQYSSDMKQVISAVQLWRGQRKDLSVDQRAALVTSYGQLKSTYDNCESQVAVTISQERLNSYQVQLANFQNKTNALSQRGFNISQLNQLLQDAQTQIITPLQNALSSANNSQAVQSAVRSYCLFDGCVNGTNFHLEAKFDVIRLGIILSSLRNNSNAFNLSSSQLSQAQSYLSDAQSNLATVGTAVYQDQQKQTIFSDIKNAAKIIVQLMAQVLKQPIGGLK